MAKDFIASWTLARLGGFGQPESETVRWVREGIESLMDEATLNEALDGGQRLAVATAVGLATA